MNKIIKSILIVCPIILTILLGINIYKYITYKENNKNLIENTNNYNSKTNENTIKTENLNIELSSLKEEKKDKLWEYERWIKWQKEIIEKIN